MVEINVGIEGMDCGMCEAHINVKFPNFGTNYRHFCPY